MSVVQLLEKENKNLKEKKKEDKSQNKDFYFKQKVWEIVKMSKRERDKCQNKDVYLKENIC